MQASMSCMDGFHHGNCACVLCSWAQTVSSVQQMDGCSCYWAKRQEELLPATYSSFRRVPSFHLQERMHTLMWICVTALQRLRARPRRVAVALHALNTCPKNSTHDKPSLNVLVRFHTYAMRSICTDSLPGLHWRAWACRALCLKPGRALTPRSPFLPEAMCLC